MEGGNASFLPGDTMSFERGILVAVAPEHNPSKLIARAAAWATRLGARLDLATVVLGSHDDNANAGTTAVGAWLDALLCEIPDQVRGSRHVLSGPAVVATLANHAATYDAIAMGTRHRTTTSRLFLGSVAEGMMRHSPVPVLVMPPGGVPVSATRKANIRLPVDVDEPNLAGATWVVQNLPEAHASAVYALPWTKVMGRRSGQGESEYERAETALATALEAQGHHNLSRFILVREEKNAGEAIAHDAQDAGIDLTVIPTHGRTGLARLVMGSVAERLVRSSTRDVLVVR